jgi:hypothetical protein
MIPLKSLGGKTIAKLNTDFAKRVESGDIKQMKLGNNGNNVSFSATNYRRAAELALKTLKV